MRTLESIVVESPVFEGLEPEYLELISGCASNVRFKDGELLFRAGEDADVFFLVRHGRVAIESFVPERGSVVIETLDGGDLVGWSWLFPPYRWHFDGRAVGLVRATSFDAACLRRKCSEDTVLGYELQTRFSGLLVQRLQATQLRLIDLYGHVGR